MEMKFDFNKSMKFLNIAMDSYNKFMEGAAKHCGISKNEADILVFYYNNKEFSLASDAAKYRGFTKSYVNKGLEQLLYHNLISIETDNNDRRLQIISVTGRGGIIAKSLGDAQDHFMEKLLKYVKPEELNTINDLIDRITNIFSSDK